MRVGYSVFGKNRLDDAMASKLRESGIEVIEVGMSAEDFPDADFHDTAAVAKRYGLDIASIHLPIAPQRVYDVTNINATGAMAYQTELIKRAGEIFGIKHVIIHSGGEPLQEEERAEREEENKTEALNISEADDEFVSRELTNRELQKLALTKFIKFTGIKVSLKDIVMLEADTDGKYLFFKVGKLAFSYYSRLGEDEFVAYPDERGIEGMTIYSQFK